MILSKWLCGPEFLSREEGLWLLDPSYQQKELSAEDPELKRDVHTYSQAVLNQPAEDFLSKVFHQYSSWDRLKQAFAWLLRFKNWLVQRHHALSVNSSLSVSQSPRGELSVDEVRVAEREIIRHLQKLSFPKVFFFFFVICLFFFQHFTTLYITYNTLLTLTYLQYTPVTIPSLQDEEKNMRK